LNLLELHEAEAADDHRHHGQHEKHAFHHAAVRGNSASTRAAQESAGNRSKFRDERTRVTRVPADASAACRYFGTLLAGSW
jgi:hypothetical protein